MWPTQPKRKCARCETHGAIDLWWVGDELLCEPCKYIALRARKRKARRRARRRLVGGRT